MMNKVKTDAEIAAMRTGGKMLATVLETLRQQIKAGMTTKELADIARSKIAELGGEPTILGYQGFPDVICISVNDEVVHGIPSDKRVLANGDVVGLDFCVTYQGMITDAAITVIVGNGGDEKIKQLLRDTQEALLTGIERLHDGVRVGDIGSAIEAQLDKKGYGIVRDLVGHGVGHNMHEDPNIPNYGRPGSGPALQAGMTIAIEPMVTLGTDDVVIADDGWTIQTRDGSISAHFEHTVLVTKDGYEILTKL
ncbi:MAG: methionyl aminopeptidase [Patescibacteria group bacterium]|nr:methionyl aminopeptidase [Patescibacteria group bacterium]